MTHKLTIWGDSRSGNCYKVALLLRLLGHDFDWHETDVLDGTTKSDEFRKLNPNGKVPLAVFPDGRTLAESNAMLLHFAEGTDYLPEDPFHRAQVYQWLFFEQYSHEPYIAVARFLKVFDHGMPPDPERMAVLMERGYVALSVMEDALSASSWFAGDGFSVADMALYAYTHVAGEAEFDLDRFSAIEAWMGRVRAQRGQFDMSEFTPPLISGPANP